MIMMMNKYRIPLTYGLYAIFLAGKSFPFNKIEISSFVFDYSANPN